MREGQPVLVRGDGHHPYEARVSSLIGNSALVRFPSWRHRGEDFKAVSRWQLTPLSELGDELPDMAGRPLSAG